MNILKKTLIAATLAAVSVGASAAEPLFAASGKINIKFEGYDALFDNELYLTVNGTSEKLFNNKAANVGDTLSFYVIEGDELDFSMKVLNTRNGTETVYTFDQDNFKSTLTPTAIASSAFIQFEDKFVDASSDFDDFMFTAYDVTDASFPASAVPEPSAIAMMLGGLGLVGFMARRRKA